MTSFNSFSFNSFNCCIDGEEATGGTEDITVQESTGRDHCGIGRGGGNPPIEQVRSEQMNFNYDLDGEVKGTTEGNFEDAILYGHDQIDMSTNESTAVYGAVHDLK